MMQHKSRTLYSVFGIVITFVMCFSVLTAGHSIWDYAYRLNGGDTEQLWAEVSNTTEEGEVLGLTEEMIAQIKVLEKCDEVRSLQITNETWMDRDEETGEFSEAEYGTEKYYEQYHCTADDLQAGDDCFVGIGLKDLSNLRKSAESLRKQTGLDIRVYEEIEMYLGQGNDPFPALYRSVEAILASIMAMFCIMILRNTLMISVVERMRDYGIYRCVGMSRRQIYLLLAVEGLMMSLVAVVFGVGIGYGLLQAVIPWLNRVLRSGVEFRFGLYGSAVLGTAVLCIAVTLYSLLEPSRQAGRLSPIEAIHNNIVLRRRNGKLMEKLHYRQSGIWGKLFGAPGEYAYKNMNRNRGRFAGFFVCLLICVMLIGTLDSISRSLYKTVENIYQGQNMEYLESVRPETAAWDPALADTIRKELSQIESVQKTGIDYYTTSMRWDVDSVLKQYLDEDKMAGIAIHHAYGKEDIQGLEPYLIEGSADYDAMTQNNGVLLCDMKYNEVSAETDFNQEDVRQTEYQVGDRIKRLNQEGRIKAFRIYEDTLQQVAQKYGIPADMEEDGAGMQEDETLEHCSDEDEEFPKYRKEFLRLLQKQGIDLSAQKEEITHMYLFRQLLRRWAVEQGYVDEYVIQGIISENRLTGNMEIGAIQFIHSMDAIPQEMVRNSHAYIDDEEMGYWDWSILVKRDVESLLDGALREYGEKQNHCSIYVGQSLQKLADDGTVFAIEEYQDMVHTMQIVKMISAVFVLCIGLICMIQIYNTVCSNLLIRRKELWLYEVVGMNRKQRLRMLLLEYLSAVILAVILGYFLAWGLSWYIVELLLNEDGFIQYAWSGMVTAASGLCMLVLIYLVCMAGIRSSREYISQ